MLLRMKDVCPPVDAVTLLHLRGDAYQAWMEAPRHQSVWLDEYRLLGDLLDLARTGPVALVR